MVSLAILPNFLGWTPHQLIFDLTTPQRMSQQTFTIFSFPIRSGVALPKTPEEVAFSFMVKAVLWMKGREDTLAFFLAVLGTEPGALCM